MYEVSRPEVAREVRIVEPALTGVSWWGKGGGTGGGVHVVADEGAEADAAFVGEVVRGEGDVVADAADGLGDGGGVGGVEGWGDGVGAVGAHVVAGKVEGDRTGD